MQLEVRKNETLQNVILEQKQRFILPSDPHALIDLQNLGFSQNQIRRLDRYFFETAKKSLMPSRERNFRDADKMTERVSQQLNAASLKPRSEKIK